MDEITFAVVIHHGGRINSSKRPHYAGGKATQVCENLDIDRLSYPEIMSYVKEDLGYDLDSIIGLYYFKKGEFILVQDDRTVLEIANKLGSGAKLEFYVEHMSSHTNTSNLVQALSAKGCCISQGVKKVVGEASQGTHNMVHTFSENIVGDLDDETHRNEGVSQLIISDNINMDFLIDDEEEELQQSLDNVRAFERENMFCCNENELNGVDEDDAINSVGSESGNDSSCSFYLDSDDNCSYYSETDEECGDRALRRLSKIIRFDPKATIPIFCCGMVFQNIEECRDALAKYAIMKGVQVHFIKNDKVRVRAGCMEKCPWKFYASKDGGSDNFVVKTYIPNHKCHRKNSNSLATSKYLAKHLRERLMSTPYIKARELKELCKIELKLRISLTQARNVRGKLLESLIGSYTEEYKRLHDYVHEINISNPGTTCVVKASKDEGGDLNYFRGFYVCFAACKKGWLEGCRKIIGVDGCFLKDVSKGQLLCAIGRDGNDQMFPIAWAVVAVENKENWGWFLYLLKHDLSLEDGTDLTIVSDMQKGLDSAINEYLPKVEHRMCARHVYAAWAKKWRGEERKIAFWNCSRSTFENELKTCLQSLNLMGDGIVQDLSRYNIESFSKAYFRTTPKCDVVDNNMAETFNGWIIEARCKPIITMLEEIRTQVMRRLHINRRFGSTWTCDVGPRPMKKLEKNKELSYRWNMVWNGDDGYEVSDVYNHDNRHIVHLNSSRCTCRKWDLTGIPCQHAICAIYSAGKEPQDYISHWYRETTYMKAYQYMMQPVPGKILWADTGKEEIVPPPNRKLPGRPKVNRKKDKDETRKIGKLSKRGKVMRCGYCKQTGHNIRKCSQRPKESADIESSRNVKRKDIEINKAPVDTLSAELVKEVMPTTKNVRRRSTIQVQHPSAINGQQGLDQPLSLLNQRPLPMIGSQVRNEKTQGYQVLPIQKGKEKKTYPRSKPGKVPAGYGCFVNQSIGETILNPGTNSMQTFYGGSSVNSSQQQSAKNLTHAPLTRR